MPVPRALSERIASMPFASDSGHRILALDTNDDSIDLAPGAYEAYNDGTTLAYVRIAAATSVPADKDAEVAGQFVMPGGSAATFVVGGAATVELHVKLASGTANLHLIRKPL